MQKNKNHYNCIYLYVNKTNGHKYVGQAKNLNNRHRSHMSESRNKNRKAYEYPLSKALRKYGEKNFEIIILKENLATQCLLNFWECYYIEKYDCLSRYNYNIASGGSNGYACAGKTKEEMEEIRKKISNSLKGRVFSEEHKEKIGNASKGRFFSEESKQKISVANRGENSAWYGKHHTEETKKKISEANKGKIFSEETRKKISESTKGRTSYNKGKKSSESTRKKISEAKSKKIIQFDENMNFIKIWNSAKEASTELKIEYSGIRNCCKGKQKKSGGFIWREYEEGKIWLQN